MTTEVRFTMSIPAFDALRRIVQRDFLRDMQESQRIMALPESERDMESLRALMRQEHERGLIERTLGFDSSADEFGKQPQPAKPS